MKKLLFEFTKKNWFIVYFIIITGFANGQITITGKVVDKANNPIEFANVVLLSKVSNSVITGTTTNSNGYFTIKTDKKGAFILQISFVGFKNRVKNITSSIDLGKLILTSNNNLEEVVITARKNIIEKLDDKIIFNVQNSPLNKGNDGIEVLKNAPIIWVNNSDQVLIHQEPAIILVNGRKINLKGTDLSNYIKNINSENIQKIEIQTNTSANMDGNITGGIINIILKKKPLGLNASVKSYYTHYNKGLFDLYNGFSLNYGSKKWNAYLRYNFTKNKGNGNFVSEFILKENQQFQQSFGNFYNRRNSHNYKIGFVSELSKNQEFGLEFYGTNNNRIFNNSNKIIITENIPITKGNNYSNEKSNKYIYNTILNYSYKIDTLGGNIKVVADYLKHNYNNKANNNSIYEFGNISDITEKNTNHSKTEIYSFQADLHKTIFKKFKTDVGFKHITTKRENSLISETLTNNTYVPNDRTSAFIYNEKILAGYISVGYKFNEKNYLKAGLRIENTNYTNTDVIKQDKNSRNYISWFPSIYYSKELSDKNSISASYSRRLRRPSFNVLNNRVNKINDFRLDIGNPNLKPEFIDKYEITYNAKKHYFSVYCNQTTDAINGIWRIEDGVAIHQNQNYGTRIQYGFQYSSATVKLNKWWSFGGNLHIYNKIFTNPNFNLHKVTSFFFLRNSFEINNTTSLEISGNYMSPFLSANYISAESFTTSLVLKKSFLDKKLNVRFYFDDIFNSIKNKMNADFKDSNFYFYQKRNTRSFTIWLRYNFLTKNKISNKRNHSINNIKNRL